MATSSKTRIYIIAPKKRDAQDTSPPTRPEQPTRLIRATNQAHALRHITNELDVKLASQDDLEREFGNKVTVEIATNGDEP